MIHDRLDIERWVAECPLSRFDDDAASQDHGSGPLTAAYAEQIRDVLQKAGHNLGPAVPIDLCVWKWGDSERRDVTKIGGVPYWPAGEPWPMTADTGEPFTFIAQFCFADSKDILPALPGDILSVFAHDRDYAFPLLGWLRLGSRQEHPSRLPPPQWKIAPCHAVLHRTADYPEANFELFEAYPYPLSINARVFRTATKIGGVWWQRADIPDPDAYDDPDVKAELLQVHEGLRQKEREFICQLNSVGLTIRHPFINVPAWDDIPAKDSKTKLMIADYGGLDFFYDGTDTNSNWHSG